MSFLSEFIRLFSEFSELPDMAKQKNVAAAPIPNDAAYVTVGPALLVSDGVSIANQFPRWVGNSFMSRTTSIAEPGFTQQLFYLVRTTHQLMIIRDNRIVYSTELSTIREMVGYIRGGFTLVFDDGKGMIVSSQSPVQVPEGAQFRTIHGATNPQFGWQEELLPFGVAYRQYETSPF